MTVNLNFFASTHSVVYFYYYMRFRILILTSLVFSPLFAFATDFPRTLKVGMRGEDVRALQVFLNTDSETRIAETGAGSFGNETDYFGPATKRAVIKFQEKYSSEILAPLGLMQGTGFFGEKTRSKALAITKTESTSSVNTEKIRVSASSTISSLQTATTFDATELNDPIPWTPDMVVPNGVNPNSINLEYALSEIEKVGRKQGMDDARLSVIEKIIREKTATTTDLTKEFFTTANIKYAGVQSYNKLKVDGFLGRIFTILGVVKIAEAITGSPWGGKVVTAWPCTCPPDVWLLTITPLPPTYATVLAYIGGTQLFATYIPTPHTGQSFLGFYEPAIQVCGEYVGATCTVVPSEGFISPEVGSSI